MTEKRRGTRRWLVFSMAAAVLVAGGLVYRVAKPRASSPARRASNSSIVAYTGGGAQRGPALQGTLDVGQQFTVTRPGVVVRDLGIWDDGGDGLASAHTLALYTLDRLAPDATATPLRGGSVTVPAGDQAALEEGFRFVKLAAPLALAPGHYALIAHGMDDRDPYGSPGNLPVPSTGVAHAAPHGAADHCSVSFHYTNGLPPPLRILPLGDSVTVGSRGTNAGYRAMLAELLTQAGVVFQFVGTKSHNPGRLPPEQRHHEGWTGRVIEAGPPHREGLMNVVPTYLRPGGVQPDVILLMIGTNDVWVDYELDGAAERLDRLVTMLVDRREGLAPHALLFLQQIIPNGDPAINARVQAYNESVAAVAARQRERGNDVTLVRSTVQLSDLHRDKLHPVDSGYRKIAQAWFDALRD